MGIAPHNRISTKHQKCRGRSPWGCRTIINKRGGGTLYQNMFNPWLLVLRTLRSFGKKLGPTGVTPTMLLWFLPAQDFTHDLCNVKQMANKTNPYFKNRPGRNLPPDTCKRDNRVNIHFNSWRAIFSLFDFTLWHHTWTSGIYDCQWSGNITT